MIRLFFFFFNFSTLLRTYGKGTKDTLRNLSEGDLLAIFSGVPQTYVSRAELEAGINVVDFLAKTTLFNSKGEIRRGIKGNGISINKEKVKSMDRVIGVNDLIAGKYILVQKGKKSYGLVIVED